ncbi:MAG: oxidoreductase [Planctomycetaceae bacterium]|nr:oxidoreductase [Planctomycetaceae bacterium]
MSTNDLVARGQQFGVGMSLTFLLGGDLSVNRIGYGAMRLCAQPGNFGRFTDWEAGKRLLRRAVELGVNFIDTAHAYGPSCNEELIGEALAPYPAGVVIATKGGVEKTAPDKVFTDGRPENLRRRCEESLRLLRVERIDLYQLHRPDPNVPFADSVGAIAELRGEGKVRHVGLSNVTLAQIEEARGIVPIASVQNRYNLIERADDPVVDYCTTHGIAYLPWGPLAAKPFAREAPLASKHGALAWLLRRSPNIIVIPGTTSLTHLEANIAAGRMPLSDEEFAAITASAT